jgi:hypothetical protein
MPKVYNYTLGDATIDAVNDRLEVPIIFLQTGDRVQTHRVKLHVSYKKHLLSSYVNSDEAYEPNAAEKNTIATVDSAVFQSGFVEYARHMAGKIIKKGQTEDFRPRDVVLDTKNIALGNDTGGLGTEIHCFPVAKVGATGCVELAKNEFQGFVAVMRFLFVSKPTENDYQNAFKAWASIKKKIEDYKLLTETQVAALKIKQKRWKDDLALEPEVDYLASRKSA